MSHVAGDPSPEPAPPEGPRRSAVEAPLLLLPFARATGAANMALDEALMGPAARGRVIVRFYGWEPPCLSLGRNQPTGDTVAGRGRADYELGVDIVRRPTAGRSVYHGPELTYAVAVPDRLWNGPRTIYRRVHAVLSAALFELGVHVDRAPEEEAAGDLEARPEPGPGALAVDARECFVASAPGEITVGGRKLVGSAQWRHAGAVLQHGSVLVRDEQARAVLDAGGAGPPAAGRGGVPADGGAGDGGRAGDAAGEAARRGPGGAIGLEEILREPPDTALLAEAVATGLAGALGVALERGEVPAELGERARELEAKYRSEEWTWRR